MVALVGASVPVWQTVLFSHDFAKAVFGEEKVTYTLKYRIVGERRLPYQTNIEAWKYHLQACVISDDPVEYYYSFVKTANNREWKEKQK